MQVFLFRAGPPCGRPRANFRLTVGGSALHGSRRGCGRSPSRKRRPPLAKGRAARSGPASGRCRPTRSASPSSPAPTVAALQDIIAVDGAARWPVAELLVLPTRVQGGGCGARYLRRAPRCCAASRDSTWRSSAGAGGSREDLWTFNHERVAARAVAALSGAGDLGGRSRDRCDAVRPGRRRARFLRRPRRRRRPRPTGADVLAELAHLGRGDWPAVWPGRSARMAERLERHVRAPDRDSGTPVRAATATSCQGLAGRLDALVAPSRSSSAATRLARDEQGRVLKRIAQFPSGLPVPPAASPTVTSQRVPENRDGTYPTRPRALELRTAARTASRRSCIGSKPRSSTSTRRSSCSKRASSGFRTARAKRLTAAEAQVKQVPLRTRPGNFRVEDFDG